MKKYANDNSNNNNKILQKAVEYNTSIQFVYNFFYQFTVNTPKNWHRRTICAIVHRTRKTRFFEHHFI